MNMSMQTVLFSIILCALCWGGAWGQEATATSTGQEKCGSIKAALFARKDAPIIFGEPYVVPAIEFRVVDASTGKPQVAKQVIFHYQWLWWEYPYPDRLLGAWSSNGTGELTQCVTDEGGKIILPEYKVLPRGWYNGNMAAGRKPKFDKLSVQVFVDRHIIAGEYTKSEIDKLREKKKPVIIFPIS